MNVYQLAVAGVASSAIPATVSAQSADREGAAAVERLGIPGIP